MRRTIRGVVPLLAFSPACVLLLHSMGVGWGPFITRATVLALLPATSFSYLVESYFGKQLGGVAFLIAGVAWSCFIAYGFHKVARIVTDVDFDWTDCGIGFVVGFIPGMLLGWRYFGIRFYKIESLLTWSLVGGCLGGAGLGIFMGALWTKSRIHVDGK